MQSRQSLRNKIRAARLNQFEQYRLKLNAERERQRLYFSAGYGLNSSFSIGNVSDDFFLDDYGLDDYGSDHSDLQK